MLPHELKSDSFRAYPPQAHTLLADHLALLQQMPLSLLPLVLREAIEYDWRFPTERKELEDQFSYLEALSATDRETALEGFAKLSLSSELERLDWVNAPAIFSQQLTAHLWATHQMDTFRAVADAYAASWRKAKPTVAPSLARLGIVIVGKGVANSQYPLFRKLRPHGVFFTKVSADNGLSTLLQIVSERAAAHPIDYGHWYIDGGSLEATPSGVAVVSYQALTPVRNALLERMQKFIGSGSAGPEGLRTMLSLLKPQDLGMSSDANAATLNRFQINLLTEGSGTQIFSTTFAQWAARETLRRAQPVTLLVRFAPRQRQQPMNEMLSATHREAELDPEGSLIDADMGAYYTWLNQQRLVGAEKAGFLVWFEGHDQAVAIGPSLPRGTTSSSPMELKKIVAMMA